MNTAQLLIKDNIGTTVYNTSLKGNKTAIDINYLPAGIYHVTVVNGYMKNNSQLILN